MSHASNGSLPTANIRFASWEAFGAFLGQQGSARGLFVRAATPPPIGTELGVRFVLPDGSDLLLSGRVVHTVNPLEAEALGEDPGMGVQFTHMSAEQARALQELMVKALNAPSLAPPPSPGARKPSGAPAQRVRSAPPVGPGALAAPGRAGSAPPTGPAQARPVAPDNDPRLHEAAALLGRARIDAAEQKVAEVLRERPSSIEGRVILFTAQARRAAAQFDFATATDKYRALLAIDPNSAEAKAQLEVLRRDAETGKALVERVFGPGDRSR